MTIKERKQAVVNSINHIKNRIVVLKYDQYDGGLSYAERQKEIQDYTRGLLHLNQVLLQIIEEELKEAA